MDSLFSFLFFTLVQSINIRPTFVYYILWWISPLSCFPTFKFSKQRPFWFGFHYVTVRQTDQIQNCCLLLPKVAPSGSRVLLPRFPERKKKRMGVQRNQFFWPALFEARHIPSTQRKGMVWFWRQNSDTSFIAVAWKKGGHLLVFASIQKTKQGPSKKRAF